MTARITYRALPAWADPRTETPRSGGQFKVTWPDAQAHLRSEADHLGADLITIEVVVNPNMIRADSTGFLRGGSDAVTSRGVVVSMDTHHGPMRFACDTYVQPYYSGLKNWQLNVRAIGLTLEALRGIDRWGATRDAAQYRGYMAIESGAIALPAAKVEMTKDQAAAELGRLAGWRTPPDWADPAVVLAAYRAAIRLRHPDQGGSRSDWDRLQEAARVLGVAQ